MTETEFEPPQEIPGNTQISGKRGTKSGTVGARDDDETWPADPDLRALIETWPTLDHVTQDAILRLAGLGTTV